MFHYVLNYYFVRFATVLNSLLLHTSYYFHVMLMPLTLFWFLLHIFQALRFFHGVDGTSNDWSDLKRLKKNNNNNIVNKSFKVFLFNFLLVFFHIFFFLNSRTKIIDSELIYVLRCLFEKEPILKVLFQGVRLLSNS